MNPILQLQQQISGAQILFPMAPQVESTSSLLTEKKSVESENSFWQVLASMFSALHHQPVPNVATTDTMVTDEQIEAARVLFNNGEIESMEDVFANVQQNENSIKESLVANPLTYLQLQQPESAITTETTVKQSMFIQPIPSVVELEQFEGVFDNNKNSVQTVQQLEKPENVQSQSTVVQQGEIQEVVKQSHNIENQNQAIETTNIQPKINFAQAPQGDSEILNLTTLQLTTSDHSSTQNNGVKNFRVDVLSSAVPYLFAVSSEQYFDEPITHELVNDNAEISIQTSTPQVQSKQELLMRLTFVNDNHVKRNNSLNVQRELPIEVEEPAVRETENLVELNFRKDNFPMQLPLMKPNSVKNNQLNKTEVAGERELLPDVLENTFSESINNKSTAMPLESKKEIATVTALKTEDKINPVETAELNVPREIEPLQKEKLGTRIETEQKEQSEPVYRSANKETKSFHQFSAELKQQTVKTENSHINPTVKSETAQFISSPERVHQLLENVSKIISQQAKEPMQEVRILLKPESLGELMVKVAVEENKVQAQIDVTNNAVKALLESNLTTLKESFSQRGLEVQRLSVQTGNELTYSHSHQQFHSKHQRGGAQLIDENEEEALVQKYFGYNTIEIKV